MILGMCRSSNPNVVGIRQFFWQIRNLTDFQNHLSWIRICLLLHKACIHHLSLSILCYFQVNKSTLNSCLLICIILNAEWDWDISFDMVFSMYRLHTHTDCAIGDDGSIVLVIGE